MRWITEPGNEGRVMMIVVAVIVILYVIALAVTW